MFQKVTEKFDGKNLPYDGKHFHGILLFFIWVLQLTGASMGLTDDRLGKMIFLVSFGLSVHQYCTNYVFKNWDAINYGVVCSGISAVIAILWAINYPATDNWQTMFVVVTMFVSFLLYFFNLVKALKD